MRRLIVLAAACTLANGLIAQTTTGPVAEKPAKEKKVCRRQDVTGSIMTQHICHSKDEWAQIDAENARNASHALGRDGVAGANAATHQ
jgi:hypothetical protein